MVKRTEIQTRTISVIVLLLSVAALIALAVSLDFTQDDAYISYRYVANYLDGKGLVFNDGERVEGFTNFGWIGYLIVMGRLGLDYMLLSKATGLFLGVALVVLSWLLARLVWPSKQHWCAAIVALLVGTNHSLAYWSPAGLETAAFSLLATLSLYLYLRRSYLLIWSLSLAVLLRPEGALVAGLLIAVELIVSRTLSLYLILSVGAAFVISLPYVGFKLAYYDSLLPNSFYAKTGFTLDRLVAGLEYVGRFLSHYSLYGVSLLLSFVFLPRLSVKEKKILGFTLLYMIYVVVVGGDVLRVHRFLIPILAVNALVLLIPLRVLTQRLQSPSVAIVYSAALIVLVSTSYFIPREFVLRYNKAERSFVHKMEFIAGSMKISDTTDFSVALPTIGAFSYALSGHRIIDLLGLTDSTIARHPEEFPESVAGSWRERKHNSSYVLSQAPDYILFSTGLKPSAPAEISLIRQPEFQRCYRTISWGNPLGRKHFVFKKVREPYPTAGDTLSLAFVEAYSGGLVALSREAHQQALALFEDAIRLSPSTPYIYALYFKAVSLKALQRHRESVALFNQVVAVDSTVYEAHMELFIYATLLGDESKAAVHAVWLKKLVPWFWPVLEAEARNTTVNAPGLNLHKRPSHQTSRARVPSP